MNFKTLYSWLLNKFDADCGTIKIWNSHSKIGLSFNSMILSFFPPGKCAPFTMLPWPNSNSKG